jgi:hypothetical protein
MTMGVDAWKKAVELLGALLLTVIGTIIVVYSLLHPEEFDESTGLMKRIPDWFVAICVAIAAPTVLVCIFPYFTHYWSALLGIPFIETRYGRRSGETIARSAMISTQPTTRFYFAVSKSFEEVRLAEGGVVVGDSTIRYKSIYKAFLSRKRGILVLRAKWKGGPRDIIADLSGLSEEQVDGLRDLLDERLPESARRYGFGPLSGLRTFGRAYDPWDCWSAQKKWGKKVGGEFRRRWKGWHIPADAPTISLEDGAGKSGAERGKGRDKRARVDAGSSWLPVGSVVRVRGQDVMILGRNVEDEASNRYEYAIVPYPEGMTGRNDYYVCSRDDVQEVLHRGYINDMEERLEERLEAGGSALDAEWDSMEGYGGYDHDAQ